MQIDIQARNFSLTDALRSHAERRLRFALTCCDDYIQRAVMRLSDINGPRGGSDKRCHQIDRQQTLLKQGCPLVMDET